MKKIAILFIGCILFTSACDKKSSTTPSEEGVKDLSFTYAGEGSAYLVLHSADGQTIDQILELQVDEKLDMPDYTETRISFTLVPKPQDDNSTLQIQTVYNAPLNDFHFQSTQSSPLKMVYVKLDAALPSFDRYSLSCPNTSATFYAQTIESAPVIQMQVLTDYPDVFLGTVSDASTNVGQYGILNKDLLAKANADTLTVTVDQFMQKKTVETSKAANMIQCSTIHTAADGSTFSLTHSMNYSFRQTSTTWEAMFAPNLPAAMYNTVVSSSSGSSGWNVSVTSASIPGNIEIPESHVSATPGSNGVSNISKLGDFDAYRCAYYDPLQARPVNWTIYADPGAQSIVFPSLPNDLKEEINLHKMDNTNAYFYGIDVDYLSGYSDYLAFVFNDHNTEKAGTAFTVSRSLSTSAMAKPSTMGTPFNPLLQ